MIELKSILALVDYDANMLKKKVNEVQKQITAKKKVRALAHLSG